VTEAISRRRFLVGGAMYGGGLWLTLNLPRPRAVAAAEQSSERATLSDGEWKTLEAICGRIVPKDRDPGAVEAGCVNFIDKALANEDAELSPVYRSGLSALDDVSKQRYQKPFVALEPAQQDALLASLQDAKAPEWQEASVTAPDFFETLRAHTVIGFLADPGYGGNRDYVGWKLVGYPGPRHQAGGYTVEQMKGTAPIEAIWGEDV
jgi:gluconate 2-dehydrogenase gamma chain